MGEHELIEYSEANALGLDNAKTLRHCTFPRASSALYAYITGECALLVLTACFEMVQKFSLGCRLQILTLVRHLPLLR